MTIFEAERASKEMVLASNRGGDSSHYKKLNKSIKEMDLDALSEVLKEGETDNINFQR